MSSDEEDLADDADATEARKKARQGDDDFGEEMSDEEVELNKDLDKELGDDPEEIPDFDDDVFSTKSPELASRTPSPDDPDEDFEMDIENNDEKVENLQISNRGKDENIKDQRMEQLFHPSILKFPFFFLVRMQAKNVGISKLMDDKALP